MAKQELLLETRRFRVVRQEYETPDGLHSKEVILHPGAAIILPLTDDGQVCLVRNYRPAVGKAMLELPAGTLEAGEEPRATALRELEEETGWRARSMELLLVFYASPGILNERMHLFVARGLTPGEQKLDAGELVEPVMMSWQGALEAAMTGKIDDAKTLVALFYGDRVGVRSP